MLEWHRLTEEGPALWELRIIRMHHIHNVIMWEMHGDFCCYYKSLKCNCNDDRRAQGGILYKLQMYNTNYNHQSERWPVSALSHSQKPKFDFNWAWSPQSERWGSSSFFLLLLQCCFSSTETVSTTGGREPTASTSTFTQLLCSGM